MVMKNIFIFVATILLFSCSSKGEKLSDEKRKEIDDSPFELMEIDGCEYLYKQFVVDEGTALTMTMTHKGNCKNSIHQCH